MSIRTRTTAALGLLALLLPMTAPAPAHAEEVAGVRRVACPTPAGLAAVARSFDGRTPERVQATPTSCTYLSGDDENPVITFRFVEAATPGEAADDIRDNWPDEYPYPFAPQPVPGLGADAFYWASASAQTVYWQFQPGVVAQLWGLADSAAGVARTAQAFRPMMEVYTVPGERTVNGRDWRTTCENYSATARCRTDIMATTVKRTASGYQVVNDWAFNSLTYRWSPRSLWVGNPLARTGSWTAPDGRQWRTECDTATTGRGACRSYARATVVSAQGGTFRQYDVWLFNNQVLFSD